MIGLAAAILAASVSADPATAAPVTRGFAVEVDSGGLAGETFPGFATFDDSLLGAPAQLGPSEFSLNFTFLGEIFTEQDDFDFDTGNFPQLQIDASGDIVGIQYLVDTLFLPDSELDGIFGFAPSDDSIGDEFFYSLFNGNIEPVDEGEGRLVSRVPVPATLGLLMAGLAGIAAAGRRRSHG